MPHRVPCGERHGSRTKPDSVIRGEQHARARLTAGTVQEIKERYAVGGISKRGLAKAYGVSEMTIRRVLLGVSWTHLSKGQPTAEDFERDRWETNHEPAD